MRVQAITWEGGRAAIIDQTKLPRHETYITLDQPAAYARAIERMQVRGAPLIGITAAYGVAQAAVNAHDASPGVFRRRIESAMEKLAATRPTAVNLQWALARMRRALVDAGDAASSRVAGLLVAEAKLVHREQLAADRAIARLGAELIPKGEAALTICNTGALATGGEGTALAAIVRAYREKRIRVVYVPETRPRQQGLLTAWELGRAGVEYRLIADTAVGALLAQKQVSAAVVGADRIAANGDVANKIGTYQMAALCARHGVRFIVAAPVSTYDVRCPNGAAIAIEQRDEREITHLGGKQVAPDECKVWNPAFDVTPRELVSYYVSEHGLFPGGRADRKRRRQ